MDSISTAPVARDFPVVTDMDGTGTDDDPKVLLGKRNHKLL